MHGMPENCLTFQIDRYDRLPNEILNVQSNDVIVLSKIGNEMNNFQLSIFAFQCLIFNIYLCFG